MNVRAWELRTYVRTCVRTYVRRTYVRRGRACSAASASCAMCASRRCVHMCARCASCASARCPRSYVRTYVCTYVRTSQIHPRPPCHTPPMQFHYVRTYVSARVPLHDCGAGFPRTCARTYVRALFKSRRPAMEIMSDQVIQEACSTGNWEVAERMVLREASDELEKLTRECLRIGCGLRGAKVAEQCFDVILRALDDKNQHSDVGFPSSPLLRAVRMASAYVREVCVGRP